MKKTEKRVISLVLMLCIVVSVIITFPLTAASAEEVYYEEGGLFFDKETGTITNSDRSSINEELIIPSVIDGVSVTNIRENAFLNCTRLTNITIPDSVTNIEENAFNLCSSLTYIDVNGDNPNYCSIEGNLFSKDTTELILYAMGKSESEYAIPDYVTSIGENAFYGCEKLKSVEIPNSVKRIGNNAFSGCNSLINITIPNSVKRIGDNAFVGCSSLINITIPNSVTSIGTGAFGVCSSLTKINVDNQNLNYCSVDGNLFNKDKSKLIQYLCGKSDNEYIIPNSVTSIGDKAFYRCKNLKNIEIPESVISIGDSAFEGCYFLTSITIPNSVTNIGNNTFVFCSSLTSITISNRVTSIGNGMFYECNSLTSVTLPNSLISIGENTFSWCDSLTNITIPDSVTKIGKEAFEYCYDLTSITIPKSITSIEDYTFCECNSLTDVYYSGSEEQWNSIAIGDANDSLTNATIHYNFVIETPDMESSINENTVIVEKQSDTTYAITAPLANITEACKMIAVIYDENGAISGIEDVEVNVGDTEKVVNVTAEDAKSAKLFLWNDIQNMIPLCNSVEKQIQ